VQAVSHAWASSPRELRESLEQVGERIELPHDLDFAPAFELEDQINRSFTDDLVRDADSVVRRRIERVRDARHPPTLSDWSSETAWRGARSSSCPRR
jgi:hypothetical protein